MSKASTVVPDLEGCGPSQPLNPKKSPGIRPIPCPDKASIALARRRGTGRPPDSMIKASTVVPDLEGCGPSQPWNPKKGPGHSTHTLSRPDKASITLRGAEGPDALDS